MTDDLHPVHGALSVLTGHETRRTFLARTTLGVIAAGALSACKPAANAASATPPATPHPDSAGAAATVKQAADAMDAKGIKSFPAKTEGKGNQVLAPKMDNGVKVFDLTSRIVQWEVEPGRRVEAWTYNGVVPAPQLNVAPSERWDTIVHCTNPGTWAFHCHLLQHAETDHGMFGMVTVLIVNT